MADAIISVVAERLMAILEEQIRNEVSLVRGVKKEARKLSDELRRVGNVLDDADRRGFQDKSVREWLKRLEDASYEMDDVLDEWNISRIKLEKEQQDSSSVAVAPPHHKVCPFIPSSSCLSFKKIATRRDIALKIKYVKAQLDGILEEKNRYNFLENQGPDHSTVNLERITTSFVEIDEIKGRDIDRDNLVSRITSHSTSASLGDQLGPIHITSIVGTGGIGKTTLAQLVYNDNRVKDCFSLRIWICVSDPLNEAKIVKEIVEKVRGSAPSTDQLQRLLELLTESISGKKFLLVLDDVWNGNDTKWGPLKSSLKFSCAPGSRILVTTRNERVARNIGTLENEIHHLGQLTDNDCWLVLHHIAFSETSENINRRLLDIGQEIAKRCKGLPLAAKTLGSLLRFKNTVEEWEDILKSEIWQLESTKVDIFPHLLLSYNDLSPAQKRCFSYCAVFPKDYKIDVEDLIRMWMALGYLSFGGGNASELEHKGREYFDNLANRSLFQEFVKDYDNENIIRGCKMHDIVHDFAQFVREGDMKSFDDRVEATILKEPSSCKTCSPLLVFRIKEYRSLLLDGEAHSDINVCDCLASLRVLKFRKFRDMSKGIEKLIHLRYLDLSFSRIHVDGNDIRIICMLSYLQSLLLVSCGLVEIPSEIGNLTKLRHLDLSVNHDLKELPESISDLHELRNLDVSDCSLSGLPQGIDGLVNLKHLVNYGLQKYPQGLAKLTSLQTLKAFYGGGEWSKLGLLKNLNQLNGSLSLVIKLVDDQEDDIVEQARKAELRKKIHLLDLIITFRDKMDENKEEVTMRRRLDVIDALEPQPNLQCLRIMYYKGSKFPGWIGSLHKLRQINLSACYSCSSLPHLGKLSCLEYLGIYSIHGFQVVGREFLGMTLSSMASSSSSSSSIGFPKLKALKFFRCSNWKEWEDITAEEEESAVVSVMPCLMELEIKECKSLKVLPHRLLRKASSIQKLTIDHSSQLLESYKEGALTKFVSHIPQVEFVDSS